MDCSFMPFFMASSLVTWKLLEKGNTPTNMLSIPYKINPPVRFLKAHCSINSEAACTPNLQKAEF